MIYWNIANNVIRENRNEARPRIVWQPLGARLRGDKRIGAVCLWLEAIGIFAAALTILCIIT